MKRTAVVCVIALLALAIMGFGFAKWSDNVSISAAAQSGKLSWGFVPGSDMGKDAGPDWTCDTCLENVRPSPEGKDVGSTTTGLSDTNGDGVLDLFTVDVKNAYPCYYNELSAKVQNFGTIPVIIQIAKLTWMGHTLNLEDGTVYWLGKDGQVIEQPEDPPDLHVGDNWVMEFCWMNNAGHQQHPGQKFEESFEFHVLQPAEQSTTYTFSIGVEAIQWNESTI